MLIEKDFYRINVVAPDLLVIAIKFSGHNRPSIVAKFIEGKITYSSMNAYDEDLSKLPKSMTDEIERIFHARSMY